MQTSSTDRAGLAAGIILIVSTLLTILAMAHHPSTSAQDMAGAIEQIRQMAVHAAWVHGSLIGLMLVSFWALTEYSQRRGMERPLVRGGLVFYGAGVMTMIGAAAVSGFVTSRIPSLLPDAGGEELHVIALLINLSGFLNQAFANIGAVAMSAGILVWSIGLLHSTGWTRLVGGLGVVAGLAPAAAIVVGGLHLNVWGMTAVVLVQAVWNIAIGALLIARKA